MEVLNAALMVVVAEETGDLRVEFALKTLEHMRSSSVQFGKRYPPPHRFVQDIWVWVQSAGRKEVEY